MSDEIDTFAEAARRYCAWVEGDSHEIVTARGHLLALLQTVTPLVALRVNAAHDYPDYEIEGWNDDHKRMIDLPFRNYRECFFPIDLEDTESCVADLRDDLAGIHGDLQVGLAALEAGDRDGALWEWQFSYLHHWGHHASAALYAVDEYCRRVYWY